MGTSGLPGGFRQPWRQPCECGELGVAERLVDERERLLLLVGEVIAQD
jgi:hypothetical protein